MRYQRYEIKPMPRIVAVATRAVTMSHLRDLRKDITPNQKRGRCKSLVNKYTKSTVLIPLSAANIKPCIITRLTDGRGPTSEELLNDPHLDLDRTPRE